MIPPRNTGADVPLGAMPVGRRLPVVTAGFTMVGAGDSTTNTNLAAALLASGIPFDPVKPFEEFVGEYCRIVYYFAPSDPEGTMRTGELIAAWDNLDAWLAAHPNHPFSYAACGAKNKERLLDLVKARAPQIVVSKGRSYAVIRANAPVADQDRILCKLERM